jgi:hypothetical protein
MMYLPPSVLGFFNKRHGISAWIDHVPFAYDLVAALQPKCIVELGTQAGVSYFAFCQAVKEHGVPARCYAVDTWAGDAHSGAYEEKVYVDVARHNEERYAQFSTLMRMRFEEALPSFRDGSIDLLHIDGFHTYEAVRGDFEAWYPKVSPGGIVLFHDIAARLLDFGAWRFWDEISARHASFAFRHGYGLGVLRKPGDPPLETPLLQMLFSGDEAVAARLRAFYVHASRHVELIRREERAKRVSKQRALAK